MIAGGAEAPLTYTFFKAWEAMHVLAPPNRENPPASCQPFAKNRSGLVLGEGAAMIVLEEWDSAVSRGPRMTVLQPRSVCWTGTCSAVTIASANGWIPQSKTGKIQQGKTTTVNFNLRPTGC